MGGFVGYFGYEMKHECGALPDLPSTPHVRVGERRSKSGLANQPTIDHYSLSRFVGREQSDAPDAAFLFADRVVVFDHVERTVYLVCLVKKGQEEIELESCRVWFANVEHSLASASSKAASEFPPAVVPESKCGLAFALHRSRKCYQGLDFFPSPMDETKLA